MEQMTGGDDGKKKRVRRTRSQITEEVMKAVSRVMEEQGFSKLGINSVSEAAGVEKPFIYRNYSTFEKVLEEYVLRNDYWMTFILQRALNDQVDIQKPVDIPRIYSNLLVELFTVIDEKRDFRNIILWELYEDTPFIRKIAQRREAETTEEIALLEQYFENSGVDIAAITSLFIAGIYYLVLHRNISTFCGIDFKTKEGKKRVVEMLKYLSRLMFEHIEYNQKMAKKMLAKGLDINLIAELTELSVEEIESFK